MGYSHGDPNSAGARYRRRRLERLAASPAHHTSDEWEALKAKYDFRCVACSGQEERRCIRCWTLGVYHGPACCADPLIICDGDYKLFRDHVVPVSRGGHDGIDNIQPLCFWCNHRKGTKSTDYRPTEA